MTFRNVASIGGFTAFTLLVLAFLLSASQAQGPTDKPPKPPLGLPPVQWPEDDPYSAAKVELGRFLYFDKRVSSDGTLSCASCHAPEKAFTDAAPVSTGIGGQKGGRSAPTVINRAYSTQQFWDGRSPSLEDQAKGPIANPIEMTAEKSADAAHAAVVKRLKAIPGYVKLFEKVFGTKDFHIDHVVRAIATFERTVYSGNSPYDRYNAGDKKALTEPQIRGMDIFFNKVACDSCHLGFNFTDGSYENVGIGMDKEKPDLGRFVVSGREEDKGAFKTPSLREIEHTGPYMHDGSLKTLDDVVEHYNKGGIKNPHLSARMKPLNLSVRDKADLVDFLKALSGEGWQQIKAPEKFPE
jgi:cytochrome c peroxidase